MAKRQNFIVGSTNPNTVVKTAEQLNTAWNKYEVLKSGDLDGVFNAVSDYSNDSSNEIANAIQSLTGSQPTGATQTELASALTKMREDIETSSLTFKGYIATSAPSSSTYGLVEGNLWINSATLPTSFPIPAASIKEWNGTSWVNYGSTYTVADFDFFRNINDNEGYYWFGGQWTVMSTDMSTDYFTLNQTSGKWEIKSSVNLPGAPTTATPAASDDSTKLATTAWVRNYAEAAGSYANTNLSNLSSTGQNISNWSTNVSNCIIEIPQDIQLELNNGTLTLKSGSVVYKPNGVGVYTKLTTVDATYSGTDTSTYQAMVFYDNSLSLEICSVSDCLSGTSAPSTGVFVYYNTSTNKINLYGNGIILGSDRSFPVAIVTMSGASGITSIDQIFNGFGYIGSTIFALPGVKGLIPDGRNSDGTLKNTAIAPNSVITRTFTSAYSGDYNIFLSNIAFGALKNTYVYDKENNRNKDGSNNYDLTKIGIASITSGQITSFSFKQVFRAVDYSDFADIAAGKANTNLNNVSAGIDFVVESQLPTAGNNYTWYRKYKSGWVEQGGVVNTAVTSPNTINLPITMADANYTPIGLVQSISNGTDGYTGEGWAERTTTSFKVYGHAASAAITNAYSWMVFGMAA